MRVESNNMCEEPTSDENPGKIAMPFSLIFNAVIKSRLYFSRCHHFYHKIFFYFQPSGLITAAAYVYEIVAFSDTSSVLGKNGKSRSYKK